MVTRGQCAMVPTWSSATRACGSPRVLRSASVVLPPRAALFDRRTKALRARVADEDGPSTSGSFGAAGGVPEFQRPGFLTHLVHPLRDFGLGRTSLVQGGVGLFIFAGIGFSLMLVSWARGGQLGRRGRGYQAVLELPLACGVSVGTPVRLRGVPVGSVLRVTPSLERVEVLVGVRDAGTLIPRSALIEANQSGLIGEPLVDITPLPPLPTPRASPLDPACEEEGAVVCHMGRIRGRRGVAVDDLVLELTRLARLVDGPSAEALQRALRAAAGALEGGAPLLARAGALAEQAAPLLEEMRSWGLVPAVEALASAAADAARDVRRLQGEVLTPDNVQALRAAVAALCRLLAGLERGVRDVGRLAGDRRVAGNLRQLVDALAKISAD